MSRELELLGYLGPEFTILFDMASGFPNVPLDPRCPPITGTMMMLQQRIDKYRATETWQARPAETRRSNSV